MEIIGDVSALFGNANATAALKGAISNLVDDVDVPEVHITELDISGGASQDTALVDFVLSFSAASRAYAALALFATREASQVRSAVVGSLSNLSACSAVTTSLR